jgi:transposase
VRSTASCAGVGSYDEQTRPAQKHHPIFLPSRSPELNPVENVWQYLRQNWLSNTVFENYDAIVDAACAAWRKLIAQPEMITSIGMRDWAHVGQPP